MVSTPQRIATGGTVRLDELEADAYTLEVIVTDSRGVARQVSSSWWTSPG